MHHLAIVSFVYPTNDIECLFKIQFSVLFFSKFPLQSPCNVIAMVSGTSLQHVYYSIHRLFHILARSEFDQASILRHPVLKMAYIFDSLGDVSARVLPVLRDVDGLKAVAGRLLVPASHTKVNI